MKRLRQSLVALLVGFALLVNLLVVSSPAEDSIGATILYLSIAIGLVAVSLLVRPRRSVLALTIGTAIFAFGTLRILTSPGIGGHSPNVLAITAAEIVLLVLIVLASHRIAKAMREATNVIAHLTAVGSNEATIIDPMTDPRVKREMTRSRRYQRPLSVVLLEPAQQSVQGAWPELLDEARDEFTKRYLTSKMYSHIGRHLRFVDLMFEDVERGGFLLLCPEARSEEIERQVLRIRRTTFSATGVELNAGWASFPEGAVTLEELINVAKAHLRTASAADEVAEDHVQPDSAAQTSYITQKAG